MKIKNRLTINRMLCTCCSVAFFIFGCEEGIHYDFLYEFEVTGTVECPKVCDASANIKLLVKSVNDRATKIGFVVGTAKVEANGAFVIKGNLFQGRETKEMPDPRLEIFELRVSLGGCEVTKKLRLSELRYREIDRVFTGAIMVDGRSC